MAQIKLLSLPSLDNTYQNVIDFASLAEQSTWFDNKSGRVVEGNIKTDTEQDQLVLNVPYHLAKAYDYLYFNDTSGKRNYYFITHKSIKTSDTVIVTLECDVWNTYMFDYVLMDSFVERCHKPRWHTKSDGSKVPAMEVADEGLPLEEYVVGDRTKMLSLEPTYMIVANTPLGYLKQGGYVPPTGGDGTGPGGDIANGIPSACLYRFVKGYEGFGAYPYKGGTETFYTAGYGIAEPYQPEAFNQLKPFPCSEKLASEVYGTMLINNFGIPLRNAMTNAGVKLGTVLQQHFDAFCSLAMNGGLGAVTTSPMWSKWLKNPMDSTIPQDWKTWYTNGGLAGLVARRKAEADIWTSAIYEKRAIVTINQDGSYGPPVTDNNGDGYIPPAFGSCGSIPTNENPTGFTVKNELGDWSCPVRGTVSATYPTYPSGGAHNGIDIANNLNFPIYAMRAGKVTVSGPVSGFGHAIYIDHGNGIVSRYGHMYSNGLYVKVGDEVKQGQAIAKVGNDGQSTGPHLHFDFLVNGKHINPATNLTVGQVIK